MRNYPFKNAAVLQTVVLLLVSLALACSRSESLPDRTKKLYSQNDEELLIRDFFDDRNAFSVLRRAFLRKTAADATPEKLSFYSARV